MKPIFVLLLLGILITQTPSAQAGVDAKQFAPLTRAQFDTLVGEFQDWKKKEKWTLQNPEIHFDVVHHVELRSMKLPDPVHVLRIRYWENGTVPNKINSAPLSATGGAHRDIIGIEKDGGFKILKDTGYFEPECGANDYSHELEQPILLWSKALVPILETTQHLGCAGEKGWEKTTLLLLDPAQNYLQVGEIPMSSSDENGQTMFAKISGWGGIGDPTGAQDSWANILVERGEFKTSAHNKNAKGSLSREILTWNKDKTHLEIEQKRPGH